MPPDSPAHCASCAAALPAGALACASCNTLVHAERLKALAAEAQTHEAAGMIAPAHAAWTQALELLPRNAKQYVQIARHAGQLERHLPPPAPPAEPAPEPKQASARASSGPRSGLVALGGAALLGLSKIKAFVPMLVTMAISFGAYWTAFGWKFALGLVVSIWVHEMGHVVELKRRGVHASLPMFIPGVGAFVRLKQQVTDPHVDARIGLAGPIAGSMAAVACYAIYYATGAKLWLGLAATGAMINLFNLTPLFTLDGGRAFNALSPAQRGLATMAIGVALYASGLSMLWLPLIGGFMRIAGKRATSTSDAPATLTFVALVAALTALASQS